MAEHFIDLPDPRIDRTKKHLLFDILAITVGTTMAGAVSFEEVEHFRIRTHDTFNRVFAALDHRKFAVCVTP